MWMSAYRFSESFFFSTGASNAKPSRSQGMTMSSVTRAAANSRCPPVTWKGTAASNPTSRRDAHGALPDDYLPGSSLETTHIE